ncbi:MAG: hypothetical protein R3Y32_02895 [Bacillota bacterium]
MTVAIMIVPICVGGFLGFYLSKSYKKRLDIIRETDDFISEVKANIKVLKRPIEEIVASFNFKTDLKEILQNSDFNSEYMKKDESAQLCETLEEIRYLESISAQNKLAVFQEKNKITLEKAIEEYSKKGVMYQKLGLLFGLLIGILWL